MFDRYSEPARRVLFFARYELSVLGGSTIEPEHLLLGLLRETKGQVRRLLARWSVSIGNLQHEIEQRATRGTNELSMSVEVPFSNLTKRVLNFAAEEADRLLSRHVEPEHLLLALLREHDSVAAASLTAQGMSLDATRKYLATQSAPEPDADLLPSPDPFADTHVARITQLVRDLAQAQPNSAEARNLVERIDAELMMLRLRLN